MPCFGFAFAGKRKRKETSMKSSNIFDECGRCCVYIFAQFETELRDNFISA